MKKTIRLFTTVMVCMAMALCVSCKKDDDNDNPGGIIAGHAYVDLGLPSGLLWATCNVGADKPEDYGGYFAWGETTTKSAYNWSSYKWSNGGYDKLTKYCTDSNYGAVDNKTVLDPEDDAAHVNWGGGWRIPTNAEWQELYDNTYSDWTTVGNVAGRKFISLKEGYADKSIFLPAAGYCCDDGLYDAGSYGHFWSSSLRTDIPDSAYYLYFNSVVVGPCYFYGRYFGYSVRPVCPSQN